jgi:hypothetical protein
VALDDKTLAEVLDFARRLELRIEEHKKRIEHDPEYARYHPIIGGPQTAAIRRASMDLTRALAKLRGR